MHLAENVYFCNVSGNREVNLTSLQLPYKYCRWPQQNPSAWLQLQGTEAGKTASLLIGMAVQVQVSAPSEGATIAMAVLKLRRADGTKNWYEGRNICYITVAQNVFGGPRAQCWDTVYRV